MAKDKTEYEKLIRSSTLFTLDRDTQSTAFRREALKMHENLYLYLMSINSEKYAEFGLEIIETANRCIADTVRWEVRIFAVKQNSPQNRKVDR